MKITSLVLFGIISIALFSCDNTTDNSDPTNPVENKDKDSTKAIAPIDNPEKVSDQSPVYGIDISKYQGDEMDLLNKSEDSLSFVICRSSQGITYTDPNFSKNWKEIKEKGFIRGAYHFYMSDDSPEQQAEHFLSLISDLEATDFPPVIDFEELSIAEGSDKEQVIEDLWTFIFLIEEKSGRKPIIYTDVNIGNSYLTASRFANYTLWIANYTSAESPTMPGAWKGMDWTLWQKTDDYHFENIQNDFDLFNGDLDDLKKSISGSNTK